MRTVFMEWSARSGLTSEQSIEGYSPDFVLFFGSRAVLADAEAYSVLRMAFPRAHLVGCSTGGQFNRKQVEDDTIFCVGASFEHAHFRLAQAEIPTGDESRQCGSKIGEALAAPDLRGILVLSDGIHVNGSALVAGISQIVGPEVTISGGLAGDGALFEKTLVSADCAPRENLIVALGFYGDNLEIRTGSAGGWDAFGPRRIISRALGNVLFELDGQPALDLYERYLGEEEARALPGSALLFPLRIADPAQPEQEVVRTIVGIDREQRSMIFAGDIPQGWSAQLMHGNFDRLASGAADAARQACPTEQNCDGLALLVSCIGRRLLMGQRVLDEVEAAAEELSRSHALVGFYSYGEISPHARTGFCQLHNQTMTVLTIQERAV